MVQNKKTQYPNASSQSYKFLSEISTFFTKSDSETAMFAIMDVIKGIRMNEQTLFGRKSRCNSKYYFIDSGILGLFLIDKEAMLLENLVALHLFRSYGHDLDNERVFFYNDRPAEGRLQGKKYEVDFYIPDEELAIQVSYSLRDEETRKREVQALQKLPKRLPCKRRIIVTFDEEETITDSFGTIEVIPPWKWLMDMNHISL